MGIRDTAKNNKRVHLAVGMTIALMLIVVGVHFIWSSDDSSASQSYGKAWFTADDGKSWFADDGSILPPFEKDGKTAYGCVVWTANNGKIRWVSHLYRYSDAAKRSIAESQRRLSKLGGPLPAQSALMEVKRPETGNIGWVPAIDSKGIEIQMPRCPAGDHEAVPLLP